MFCGFKRRVLKSVEYRDWMVARFHKLRWEIQSASTREQFVLSLVFALYWKDFIVTHGSPAAFANLTRIEQIAYFEEMMSLRAILFEHKDFEKAIPLEMLTMFLCAIVNGDQSFEQEVAQVLDAYASKGWDLVWGKPARLFRPWPLRETRAEKRPTSAVPCPKTLRRSL